MDVLRTKEIIKYVTLGITKIMKKGSSVSISFAFTVDILIRNGNINIKLFEIILHVE